MRDRPSQRRCEQNHRSCTHSVSDCNPKIVKGKLLENLLARTTLIFLSQRCHRNEEPFGDDHKVVSVEDAVLQGRLQVYG